MLLQQFHGWEVGGEAFKALPQYSAFFFPHRQHHLGGAKHTALAAGRIQQFGVMHDHLGGALHPQRLLERVVGLDVAAVDRLAVVGGLGVHQGQLVIALHQGDAAQIGIAGQLEQQGGAANPTAHHQHVQQLGIDRGWGGFGAVAAGGGRLAGGIAAGVGGFRRCAQGAGRGGAKANSP